MSFSKKGNSRKEGVGGPNLCRPGNIIIFGKDEGRLPFIMFLLSLYLRGLATSCSFFFARKIVVTQTSRAGISNKLELFTRAVIPATLRLRIYELIQLSRGIERLDPVSPSSSVKRWINAKRSIKVERCEVT